MLTDLRHSLRTFRKYPGFSLLTALIIALGVGVSTAIFTIVNGVLWKPYPYPHADRLVRFNEDSLSGGLNNSGPNSEDWKARSHALADVSLYRFFPALTLRFPGEDRSPVVAYAHPNLFGILGVQPVLGRLFTDQEDRPGAAAVAVITNAAWERYFGKDPTVVGRTVRASNGSTDALTITGVLPPGFDYDTVEVWLPLGRYPMAPDSMRDNHWFAGVGRLKPGAGIRQARAELQSISAALEKEYPQTNKGVRAVVQSLSDYYAGRTKTPLLVLFWAVAFVMLIACSNVVHLALTRTLSRRREIAVRLALGASQMQLVKLLLSEGLVLAVAGGALGVLAAQWMTRAAIALQPGLLTRIGEVALDGQALLYALGLTLFTALSLAVIPVWRVARAGVRDALSTARGGGDRQRQRFGWMTITGEVAMASVLLAGAGLAIQGLRNLSRVDLGYDPRGLLSLSFVPPAGKPYTDESAQALLDRVQDAARSVPGYVSSALAVPFGVGGNGMLGPVIVPGRTNPSTPPLVPAMSVTPDFFETMRIPIRQGRTLARVQGAIPEAVVNEEFVRRFLPGENPLGRQVIVWDPVRIVGVAGDSRLQGDLAERKPEVYLPGVNAGSGPTMLVRLVGDPASAAAILRERLRGAEPGLRVGSRPHHGQPRGRAHCGGALHTQPAADLRPAGDPSGVPS